MKLLFLILFPLSIALANGTPNRLSDLIPYPFYAHQTAAEGYFNKMTVLNYGLSSLQARIDIIRSAKSNIEVEYFIYALDESSKLLTSELVKAASRGVKVRMLVDKSAAIFVLDEFYAKALKEVGVELRYYNPANILQISSLNFRNHRKLISVDDRIAITGGRNVEDDYYDFSPEFNFIDRDVMVEGDLVKIMRESFDKHFEHEIAERPELPIKPAEFVKKKIERAGGKVSHTKVVENTEEVDEYEKHLKKARNFLILNNKNKEKLKKLEALSRPILSKLIAHECPDATFSTDGPGANFLARIKSGYEDKYRFLRKTIYDKVSHVNHKVIISSPYMLNNANSRELMNSMLEKDVKIELYTNSLASTDAVYVAANLYKDVFRWGRMGLDTHVHSGNYIEQTPVIDERIKKAKWGTHSKTQLYKTKNEDGVVETEIMIGTYNVDNRSNFYNNEMAIFCKGNPELAKEVEKSIKRRVEEAYKINTDYTASDKNGKTVSIFGTENKSLLLMTLIALPSWLIKPLL